MAFFCGFFGIFFHSNAFSQLSAADLIHVGDRIEIDVVGSLDFDWRGVVGPDGYLEDYDKTPEPVFARCLSTDVLADRIKSAYSRILRDPKVEVRIIDRSGRPPAIIDGAIKQPQRLILKRRAQLREIIVLSGGITDKASGKILVFRPPGLGCGYTGAEPTTLSIDIADLIAGRSESDVEVLPGDIVTVVSALPVYVIGGVAAPGVVLFRPEMTLSRAISSAGGLSKEANDSLVTIYRREDGRPEVLEAQLKQILDKRQQDIPLRPYDIVEVAEKGKPRRKVSPDTFSPAEMPAASLPVRVVD